MLKKYKQRSVYIYITLLSLISSVWVKAVEPPEIIRWGYLPWGDQTSDIREAWLLNTFLPNLIEWMLGFFAASAIVVIMIGGYMHLTAFGWEQTTKGKETIMYGIIWLLIVILSYAIVSIVQNLDFFI